MGIVQEIRDIKNDKVGMTFAELAHTPFVQQPDSIKGITEEWFSKQSDYIEQKIADYEKSIKSASAREWEVHKLRNIIDRLRKFTTDVLTDRDTQERAKRSSVSHEPEKETFLDECKQQQLYEECVDHLLEKSKRDREIARQYDFYKKNIK